MKTVVIGGRDEGVAVISSLLRHGFEVEAVYTRTEAPDFESVIDYCREKGLPCVNARSLQDPELAASIRRHAPDLLIGAGVWEPLPEAIIGIAKTSLNLHLSLLPDFRGPEPVVWAIAKNERYAGASLHLLTAALNAGDLVGQRVLSIDKNDTVLTLYRKLVRAAAELLDEALPAIREGKMRTTPQDLEKGGYFGKVTDELRTIKWSDTSFEVYNRVRSLTRPWPGAVTTFKDELVVVWRVMTDDSAPALLSQGELETEGEKFFVGTRSGCIRLLEIEYGGQVMEEAEIVRELGPLWNHRFK